MAVTIQTIGIGSVAGDGTGDTARVGGQKINTNFSNLKSAADLVLDVPQNYILGRVTASTGDVEQLTSTQVRTVLDLTTENGFVDRADSTISFTNGTLQFSISPSATSYDYWSNGIKYTKSGTDNVNITDVEGLHFIYFDGSTLTHTTTFSDTIITDYAFVAAIYWDATNNESIIFADERHGHIMDSATHLYHHHTMGALFASGLGLGNIQADGTGNSDADAQFSVASGVFWDEDIEHIITDGSPQTLSPQAQIPILYRSGANGDWRIITATNFPVTTTGTGLLAWNEWTGATWQLTEASSADFILYHYYATGDQRWPVVGIPGQAVYNTATDARAAAYEEIKSLSFGQLSTLTPESIPIATVIYETRSTYSNTVQSRIRTTDTGEEYIDWRGASGSGTGSTGGSSTTDPNAIHDNIGNEIAAVTIKASPIGADYLLIEDSAASNVKKSTTIADLPVAWSQVSSTPTTLSGYGITDGLTASSSPTLTNTWKFNDSVTLVFGTDNDASLSWDVAQQLAITGPVTFTGNITGQGSVQIGSTPAFALARKVKIYDDGVNGDARISLIGTSSLDNPPGFEMVFDGDVNKRALVRAEYVNSTNIGFQFFTTSSGVVAERMTLSPQGGLTVVGSIAASNFSGSSSGTNTGDQTSIVGITGTTAEFNTALSDGSFATGGGTATGTNTGDQTITLTGDVTGSGTGSFAATISDNAVTLAKMADVASGTVFYRKTAATGNPEVQTLATLKTDLGLTGTNSGDQTSIVGITGTIAQFNTALTDADFATGGGTATGTNTGDQTSIVGITGTLSQFNTALTDATFATGGGTVTGTSSGTNTGDQTSIVGITGTKAQFDTACTDGNFLYVGDVTSDTGTPAILSNGATPSLNTGITGAEVRSLIGAGTVTSVSVTTANGVSGSVANSTTTPAITLTLGAITPTSVGGITSANLVDKSASETVSGAWTFSNTLLVDEIANASAATIANPFVIRGGDSSSTYGYGHIKFWEPETEYYYPLYDTKFGYTAYSSQTDYKLWEIGSTKNTTVQDASISGRDNIIEINGLITWIQGTDRSRAIQVFNSDTTRAVNLSAVDLSCGHVNAGQLAVALTKSGITGEANGDIVVGTAITGFSGTGGTSSIGPDQYRGLRATCSTSSLALANSAQGRGPYFMLSDNYGRLGASGSTFYGVYKGLCYTEKYTSSTFSSGDVLWLSPTSAGDVTSTKPSTSGQKLIRVGTVVGAFSTYIIVWVEMQDLGDV